MMDSKYSAMKANGSTPMQVYFTAIYDGNATDQCLSIIRFLFDMPVEKALEVAHEVQQEAFQSYEMMKADGASPYEIMQAIKKHGLHSSFQLKLLRSLFSLSLIEAKEMMMTG